MGTILIPTCRYTSIDEKNPDQSNSNTDRILRDSPETNLHTPDAGQASLQLVLAQLYHVYHHSRLDPILRGHISILACTSQLYLTAGRVTF